MSVRREELWCCTLEDKARMDEHVAALEDDLLRAQRSLREAIEDLEDDSLERENARLKKDIGWLQETNDKLRKELREVRTLAARGRSESAHLAGEIEELKARIRAR